jgi:ribosomal-protein-alanine N-acetyltransferase
MQQLQKLMETERLLLRQLVPADDTAVFQYASNPQVTRYMDWPTHHSVDSSRDWISLTLDQWDRGEEHTWGVTLQSSPEIVIGAIGCSELADPRSAERTA